MTRATGTAPRLSARRAGLRGAHRATGLALLSILFTLASGSCARVIHEHGSRTAEAADQNANPKIVIVQSSDNPLYRLPVRLFMAQAPGEVHTVTMRDGQPPKETLRQIDAIAPALVVTLGAKALSLAQKYISNTPVLFAMVLNHRRFDLSDRPNFMGIELETPTMTEFTQFKMIAPTMHRILVIYGDPGTEALLEGARIELATLGIEVQASRAMDVQDVGRTYAESTPGFDGIWVPNDAVAMAPEAFRFLADAALRDKIPLMCSLSETFAREGALMSVSVDFRNLGSQAALMATRLLVQHENVKDIGVQSPLGGRLVVNFATASKIDLTIDAEIIPFINEIIGN
ncbi:MAG: hypothetical protein IPK13_07750 [Deltaproteobacteria bacterium]|nr:hypothetical protein [Deltaproteobacteria bacterium]